jgi:hypothetical protein
VRGKFEEKLRKPGRVDQSVSGLHNHKVSADIMVILFCGREKVL